MPGVPPVPIPNTAVKPRAANGSWTLGPARVGRCQVYGPVLLKKNRASFFTAVGSAGSDRIRSALAKKLLSRQPGGSAAMILLGLASVAPDAIGAFRVTTLHPKAAHPPAISSRPIAPRRKRSAHASGWNGPRNQQRFGNSAEYLNVGA